MLKERCFRVIHIRINLYSTHLFNDLRPFATFCDWPFVIMCDHLWLFATICNHLRHLGPSATFATICDHSRTFVTICDHVQQFATIYDHLRLFGLFATCWDHLRPCATICDQLRSFATIYDHLRHLGYLRPFANFCDHLPPFATNWDHLQPFATMCDHIATNCDHVRPLAIICDFCDHLRTIATNYDHWRRLGHVWPFALQCHWHWTYYIRIYHYSSLGLFSNFRIDLGPTCHLDGGRLCHNIFTGFCNIMSMSWYCFKISRYCIIGLNINTWHNVIICHYKGMMWHVLT